MRVFDIMLFAVAEGSAAVDAFVLCHVAGRLECCY